MESEQVIVQKMIFIYNAVKDGWTVKKIGPNKFEFTKNNNNKELNLDDYLKRFINYNLNIDNLNR